MQLQALLQVWVSQRGDDSGVEEGFAQDQEREDDCWVEGEVFNQRWWCWVDDEAVVKQLLEKEYKSQRNFLAFFN